MSEGKERSKRQTTVTAGMSALFTSVSALFTSVSLGLRTEIGTSWEYNTH